MLKLAVALAFLGLDFYTYHYLASDPVFPERTSFEDFPSQLGDWECPRREVVDAESIANLGVTDYLLCTFQNPQRRRTVGVYVGYHASQVREAGGGSGENSIHPPAHCLPGSGWDIIDNQTVQLEMPGMPQAPANVKRLVIAKSEARQLTYYWYQSRGRVVAEDWRKVLFVGFDRATQGRTDGSLIRFTVPILRDDEAGAEESFRDLAPQILARMPAHVPE